MKNGFFLFGLVLTAIQPLFSQKTADIPCLPDSCECLFRKAEMARRAGDFQTAVDKLGLARFCHDTLEARVGRQLKLIFEEINQLRISEAIEKRKAILYSNELNRKAKSLEDTAQILRLKSDSLLWKTGLLQLEQKRLALTHLVSLAHENRETNPKLTAQILREVWARDSAHDRLTDELTQVFYQNFISRRDKAVAQLLPSARLEQGRPVETAEFSPDNSLFLVRTDSGLVQLYFPDGRHCRQVADTGIVKFASFTSDSRYLVTWATDQKLRWWRLSDGRLEGSEPVPNGGIRLSPDGQWAMWLEKNDVFAKNLNNGDRWNQPVDGVTLAEFSPGDPNLMLTVFNEKVEVRSFRPNRKIGSHLMAQKEGKAFFSFDGKWLLAYDRQNHIFFAEVCRQAGSAQDLFDSLRVVADFKVQSTIRKVGFSPDNRYFLVAETEKVSVFNQYGWVVFEKHLPESIIQDCQFSKDCQSIFVLNSDDQTITQFRLDHQPSGSQPMVHDSDVNSFVFNHDGSQIYSRAVDNSLRIWDLSGRLAAVLRHGGAINRAVSSNDGRVILTASADGSVRLWDVFPKWPGQEMRHSGAVFTAVFTQKGRAIRTISADKTIREWQMDGGLSRVISFEKWIDTSRVLLNADFSGDGTNFWVLTRPKNLKSTLRVDSMLHFFNSADGRETGKDLLKDGLGIWPTRVGNDSFLLTGKIMLENPAPILPRLIDLNGKLLSPATFLDTNGKTPDSLAFESDRRNGLLVGKKLNLLSRKLFLNSADGQHFLSQRVALFPTEWRRDTPITFVSKVTDHLFSADQKLLVVCLANNQAQLFELKSGKLRKTFPVARAIIDLSFSANHRMLAFACLDGRVQVWDTSGTRLAEFFHDGVANSVSFSPDSRWLVSASNDGTARIWMLQNRDLVGCLNQLALDTLSWAGLTIDKREKLLFYNDSIASPRFRFNPPEPGKWSKLQDSWQKAVEISGRVMALNSGDIAVKPMVHLALINWDNFFLNAEKETNPLAFDGIDLRFTPYFRLLFEDGKRPLAEKRFENLEAHLDSISNGTRNLEPLNSRLEELRLLEKMQQPKYFGKAAKSDATGLSRLLADFSGDEQLTTDIWRFAPKFDPAKRANFSIQMQRDWPGRMLPAPEKSTIKKWVERQEYFISHLTSFSRLDSSDASRFRLSQAYGEMSGQRAYTDFAEAAAGDAEEFVENILPVAMEINQATGYALAGKWRKTRPLLKKLLENEDSRKSRAKTLEEVFADYLKTIPDGSKPQRVLKKARKLVIKKGSLRL